VRWSISLAILALSCAAVEPVATMATVGPCMARRIHRVRVHGAAIEDVPQLAVLEGTFDDPERTDRIADRALDDLVARGYARATLSVDHRARCGVELDAEVALGPRFHIASIAFDDDDLALAADLALDRGAAIADALGAVNAVGGVYVAYRMQRALADLEHRYRAAGWPAAHLGPPGAVYDDRAGAIALRVPIMAGRRFHLAASRAISAGPPPADVHARAPAPPIAAYLGEALPAACAARDVEACLGWMTERNLAAELDLYADPALRAYVQAVVDRLARGARLARAPRVVIADHDGTYSTAGSRIVIARQALLRLASEAELAGVLAHELAHLEGHHAAISLFGPPPDDDAVIARRDAEAIADERAVVLIERAGYAPTAMVRALRAVLDAEDDDHPLRADRIARVRVLAGDRPGVEGRRAYLAALAHVIAGRDTRLGHRVDGAWVIAALGLAFDLAPGDVIRGAQDGLVIRRAGAALALYPIGAAWARELAGALVERAAPPSPLGALTIGRVATAAPAMPADDAPLARLARAAHASLPAPPAGAHVAILERAAGALVIELAGAPVTALGVRLATAAELAAAEPPRRP
jgi:hypothetical protein